MGTLVSGRAAAPRVREERATEALRSRVMGEGQPSAEFKSDRRT